MFHLNRMLSSPRLESIVTWEVALFVVIKFLFRQELATNLWRSFTITEKAPPTTCQL